eukprot:6307478-Amphidinium_carterae.1
MAAASQYSIHTSSFGAQPNWPTRAIHHASSALPPISNSNDRVLQIIPSNAFDLAQANQPFNMRM